MKVKSDKKDWEVAREMFGTNTKEQCQLVKRLRKGDIFPHCDGWSIIVEKNKPDDIGWLISNELLEENV